MYVRDVGIRDNLSKDGEARHNLAFEGTGPKT